MNTLSPLQPLFEPKSVAIIGVSPDRPLSWGSRTMNLLLGEGYEGEVLAVGKKPVTDDRVRWAPTITELPLVPDLVVIAVPSAAAPAVIAEANRVGVGAAIVYSSGFSEMGTAASEQLERDLIEAAGDMPLLGPNCLGVVNKSVNLSITATAFVERPAQPAGPVGIVTQSGALGFVLADLLQRSDVGYSMYASVGNSSILDAAAVAGQMIERSQVEVAVLYLEGSINAIGLASLGDKARRLGKTVVALSVGRTAAGQRAALSHTSASAGDHLLLEALCRQHGIIMVDNDEQVVAAVLNSLNSKSLPPRPNLCILTMSGGAGGVLADGLDSIGVAVNSLDDTLVSAIRDLGIRDAGVSNPVDLGGNFITLIDKLPHLINLIMADSKVDGLILYLTFGDRAPDAYAELADLISKTEKPAWFIWACPPVGMVEALHQPGVVFTTIASLLRQIELQLPDPGPAIEPSNHIRPSQQSHTQTVFTELKASELTKMAGVPHVDSLSGMDPKVISDQVIERGWVGPFALKIDAADIPHRANAGALELRVGHADLPERLDALADKAAIISRDPDCRLVVQPMIAHSREAALGYVQDAVYGPALVIGAGGPDVENPTAPRRAVLLPAEPEAIDRVASWASRTLELPQEEIAHALTGIAGLVSQRPEFTEIDINPIIVHQGGLLALDALIVCRDNA